MFYSHCINVICWIKPIDRTFGSKSLPPVLSRPALIRCLGMLEIIAREIVSQPLRDKRFDIFHTFYTDLQLSTPIVIDLSNGSN